MSELQHNSLPHGCIFIKFVVFVVLPKNVATTDFATFLKFGSLHQVITLVYKNVLNNSVTAHYNNAWGWNIRTAHMTQSDTKHKETTEMNKYNWMLCQVSNLQRHCRALTQVEHCWKLNKHGQMSYQMISGHKKWVSDIFGTNETSYSSIPLECLQEGINLTLTTLFECVSPSRRSSV